VIDGATNTTTTVAAGTNPGAVAVNPVANRVYAANNGSSNVTVISEAQAQPNPLTSAITPLPGNTTTNAAQVFQFTASNSAAPPATNLYFQFDTFEGPWSKGTPGAVAGSFTGAASGLSVSTHILYAFAMDGEEATSVMHASSPVIGGITAYLFEEQGISTSTTLTAGVNPAMEGNTVTFTAAVLSSANGTPSGSVSFFDANTDSCSSCPSGFLGNVVLDNTAHGTFATSSLAVGAHPITAVYFPSPSAGFAASTSTALDETVNQAGSSVTVASSLNPATFGRSVTFTATVLSSTTGTPTGTVQFFDGSTQIGTGTQYAYANGQATFTTSSLSVGSHSITAVYGGDTNFAASTSAALTETINATLDFAIGTTTGGLPSAMVKAGQTAMYSLQLSLVGGVATDQLMLTVSCAGAPPKAMCSGPASPVTVTQVAPATVAINVSTMANGMLIPSTSSSRSPWNRLPILWVLPMLLMLLWLRRCIQTEACSSAARPAFAVPALLLAMVAAAASGCGGGTTTPVNSGTPLGTYTLTVTVAAPSNLTHTQQLTLIVQ